VRHPTPPPPYDAPLSPRGGLVYALAATLYLGLYALVFLAGGDPWQTALLGALANALPPSLLGVWVLRRYRSGRLPPGRGGGLWPHGLLAAAFAAVATAATWLFFRLESWMVSGRFTSAPFNPSVVLWQLFLGLLVFGLLATVGRSQGVEARLRQARMRTAEAEALRARAELHALRARLDPHFLFNTLHSLRVLVRRDPPAAEAAIEELGEILRYILEAGADEETRTLGEEWKLIEKYLALETLRLGDRLRVFLRLEREAREVAFPPLTLQPLVENAVRHAIAPRAAGGQLTLQAAVEDGRVRISVADDGPGAAPGTLAASPGQGLPLVRQRLERFYDGEAVMEVESEPGKGFRVTLWIPREDTP
jgi:two-component system LytT family sensor kinase